MFIFGGVFGCICGVGLADHNANCSDVPSSVSQTQNNSCSTTKDYTVNAKVNAEIADLLLKDDETQMSNIAKSFYAAFTANEASWDNRGKAMLEAYAVGDVDSFCDALTGQDFPTLFHSAVKNNQCNTKMSCGNSNSNMSANTNSSNIKNSDINVKIANLLSENDTETMSNIAKNFYIDFTTNDKTWECKGKGMLSAYVVNDVDEFCTALTGQNFPTLLNKALAE
jgi:hypothetical protein